LFYKSFKYYADLSYKPIIVIIYADSVLFKYRMELLELES
jgi:hypothetical protein